MNLCKKHRLPIYAFLMLLAGIPFAAFGSGGGVHVDSHGGGGGSGGSSGGGSGGGGGTAQDVCRLVAPGGVPTHIVPGTILIRDTFGPGPQLARPAGGSGRLQGVKVNASNDGGSDISGFWAEQPCSNTVIWMGPTGGGANSWVFEASPIDPKETPSNMLPSGFEFPNVRLAVVRNPDHVQDPVAFQHPVALVPFQAPSIPYEVSVDIPPVVPQGDWFDVGFTTSNALNNNFESAGQAWMRVTYEHNREPLLATVELHTNGLSGPAVSAILPADPSTWDTLTVKYDPVTRVVTGFFNGHVVGSVFYDASSARYTGFEGDSRADNFVVKATQ